MKLSNKCNSCGYTLTFDPETGNLKCPQCGSMLVVTANILNGKNEYDHGTTLTKNENVIKINKCANCGAKTNIEKDITGVCPYCGSSNVKNLSNAINYYPDGIMPFKISKKVAKFKYREWLRKKWFVPSKLKGHAKLNKIEGNYFPVWDFSFDAKSSYSGVGIREHHTTRTVRTSSGTKMVTDVRITRHPFSGNRSDTFTDLLISGNEKIDDNIITKLGNYGISELNVFNPAFLLGFNSSEYTMGLQKSFFNATSMANREIKSRIESSTNYTRIEGLSVSSTYLNKQYNYLYLPVWICNFLYKEKEYKFYVNGYSGFVVGSVPRSAIKIISLILGIGAVIAAIVLMALYL